MMKSSTLITAAAATALTATAAAAQDDPILGPQLFQPNDAPTLFLDTTADGVPMVCAEDIQGRLLEFVGPTAGQSSFACTAVTALESEQALVAAYARQGYPTGFYNVTGMSVSGIGSDGRPDYVEDSFGGARFERQRDAGLTGADVDGLNDIIVGGQQPQTRQLTPAELARLRAAQEAARNGSSRRQQPQRLDSRDLLQQDGPDL